MKLGTLWLALVLSVGLVGCKTSSVRESEPYTGPSFTEDQVDAGIKVYVACMKNAANELEPSKEPAEAIAIAAASRCDPELNRYGYMLRQSMLGQARTEKGRDYAIRGAEQSTNEFRSMSKNNVIRMIVEKRAKQK